MNFAARHPIVAGTLLLLIVMPFVSYFVGIVVMMVQDFVEHRKMKRASALKWKKFDAHYVAAQKLPPVIKEKTCEPERKIVS